MLPTSFATEPRLMKKECFIDATFVMAKGGCADVGATKRVGEAPPNIGDDQAAPCGAG
jgi:hypothetical protein